jgi:hypothetical protein
MITVHRNEGGADPGIILGFKTVGGRTAAAARKG